MTNVNAATATATAAAPPPPAESPQVEAAGAKTEPPPPPAPPSPAFHGGSKVYKSGPLFLSSKGIGWTSWKKRWFILTQTSLVFYRSDPNAAPSKTGEVNLTLGGIDLNSSGSVVVKEDKKLITVLFSDGRDGRAFTLKAETLEDLHEWKAALEEALSNAPNAALVTQNSLFKNDQFNSADLSSEQLKDKQTAKSLVIGRPILLALEDIDGTPSFLEKALRFLEEHGVKTEGILRQAADVEDVERRIQEYEKGKTEFSPDEDAHVLADCIKYVLRELPSSPVPASCCKALLEACRTDRSIRVNAMRSAICETFPEPNRILLQRILMMMQTVASHKAVNRMSISAVAACMAPLLLRPLLAGECDLDNDFDVGGDGSIQLLQAAAAANHAQAIVITLLEEYINIFGDVAMTHEPYTDSEESGSETEEISDDESFDEDDMTEEGSESEEDEEEEEEEEEEEFEQGSSRSASETGEIKSSEKDLRSHSSSSISPRVDDVPDSVQGTDDDGKMQSDNSEIFGAEPDEASMLKISAELSHGASRSMRRPTNLGRASAKKNLSMESIDLPLEDEAAIQKLESLKTDLKNRISDEVNANSVLQDNLELRKRDLYERRLALQKEVARLQEQLQKEIDLRKALEAALRISQLPLSVSSLVDDKMKAELEDVAQAETDVMNLKEKADDLECQINQQREKNSRIGLDISNQINQNANQYKPQEKQMDGGQRIKHESCSDRAGNERDKKRESSSSSNRQQQADAAQHPSRHSSTSRKSSSRAEGTNSTTSALSKLTHRLNFLKERRSQMASELQNKDRSGRSSSQPSVDNYQDSKGKFPSEKTNVDKSRKQEAPPNLERGKSESFPTPEKGSSKFPPRTFSR